MNPIPDYRRMFDKLLSKYLEDGQDADEAMFLAAWQMFLHGVNYGITYKEMPPVEKYGRDNHLEPVE